MLAEAGKEWDDAAKLHYCHGDKDPEEKAPDDGCAAIWEVWQLIGYLNEEVRFVKELRSRAPAHWNRREKRMALHVSNRLARLDHEYRSI